MNKYNYINNNSSTSVVGKSYKKKGKEVGGVKKLDILKIKFEGIYVI